eukprot:CAMPEP_0117686684 /NCGR_PEP_ID=MMETSP0804-20121206/22619_1 /TAXON_ID=1074897 /ORGANISM="Tetraselmis astigmatica, Strain CCMP880" /LENGTH=178 /DNA_ID=CAMNT_0005498469 /DNA_START=173 /DNA_END=707 /DNA_ORIENTATION=-
MTEITDAWLKALVLLDSYRTVYVPVMGATLAVLLLGAPLAGAALLTLLFYSTTCCKWVVVGLSLPLRLFGVRISAKQFDFWSVAGGRLSLSKGSVASVAINELSIHNHREAGWGHLLDSLKLIGGPTLKLKLQASGIHIVLRESTLYKAASKRPERRSPTKPKWWARLARGAFQGAAR